ncbi:protein O-mannosyl-transferase TMTC4-like [Leguminivora glycinivorella]|uniref:protein O-mannosyl-transferase TMTC4-like n=1 Tax=Leguminivora glycinivorella TaxID=1035111 RepID=UPI0020106A82|nr:protein O-mannosyl-transferase TMTC4-like [Leguminivora glycinivorella]
MCILRNLNKNLKDPNAKIFLKFVSVLCASSLPFIFTLNGDFVFDDSEAIIKNEAVKSESWLESFYTDFWGTNITSDLSHKSYRPLTVWSFRLNYLLSGNKLSAVEFKATNLVCHIISCLLLWCTLRSILGRLKKHKCKKCIDIGWLTTVVFAVHPVHVEAVSGAVGRADLLAATAFFLAFLCYNQAMTKTGLHYFYLTATVIFAAMSMLFKENGITVLGICLCYDFIIICKEDNTSRSKKKKQFYDIQLLPSAEVIIRITVTVLAIMLLLYGRWIVMGGAPPKFKPTDNPASFSDSKMTKVFTFSYLYVLNILLLIWPQWLCYDWSMGCVPLVEDPLEYRVVFVLAMYFYGVAVVIKFFKARRKRDSWIKVMALLLLGLPFLPAANIFYPVGFVIAERVLYIPSAGYCLYMVFGLNKLCHYKLVTKKMASIPYYAVTFLICIYALKSYERSYDWQNEHALFLSGAEVCPLNAKVHYNIAKAADAKHEYDFALMEYKEAIRLHPNYYQAMNNLGNLLKNQKVYSEAEYYLRKAILRKIDFPAAWMNLGIVLASTGRYDEAQKSYTNALRYRSNYPDCLYNLGNLYLDTNKSDHALESWLHAIKLKPGHRLAWTNILALLDNTGQFDRALQIIPLAIASVPDAPSVQFAIANIFGKMGRYEEAEKHFLKAIELFGRRVQAIHYANLGVLYHRWKKYSDAERMYKRALKLQPNFKSAQKNLETLKRLTLVT